MPTRDEILAAAGDILRRPSPRLDEAEVRRYVQSWIERRPEFLATAKRHGSPLYVLDEEAILRRAGEFLATFRAEASDCRAYFAVKSNNCPEVAAAMLKAGLGLDVSSGLELEMALGLGARDIVFSGPAKTGAELALAAARGPRHGADG